MRLQQTLLEGGVGCVLWQVLDDVHDLGKDFLRESSEQMVTLLLLGVKMLEPEFALQASGLAFQKVGSFTIIPHFYILVLILTLNICLQRQP